MGGVHVALVAKDKWRDNDALATQVGIVWGHEPQVCPMADIMVKY